MGSCSGEELGPSPERLTWTPGHRGFAEEPPDCACWRSEIESCLHVGRKEASREASSERFVFKYAGEEQQSSAYYMALLTARLSLPKETTLSLVISEKCPQENRAKYICSRIPSGCQVVLFFGLWIGTCSCLQRENCIWRRSCVTPYNPFTFCVNFQNVSKQRPNYWQQIAEPHTKQKHLIISRGKGWTGLEISIFQVAAAAEGKQTPSTVAVKQQQAQQQPHKIVKIPNKGNVRAAGFPLGRRQSGGKQTIIKRRGARIKCSYKMRCSTGWRFKWEVFFYLFREKKRGRRFTVTSQWLHSG